MPQKICGLGFDCAAMMLCPGIQPGECLNYQTCGAASELTPDEEFELLRVRTEARSRWLDDLVRFEAEDLDRIWLTKRQAAAAMLLRRGCSQTVESMGLVESLAELQALLERGREWLQQGGQQYIAPEKTVVHVYVVKRPSRPELRAKNVPDDRIRQFQREFEYYKLLAADEIFEPASRYRYNKETQQWEECGRVRAIHLSHEEDARHVEAIAGIGRRNSLMHLQSALEQARSLLARAVADCETQMPDSLPYDRSFWSQLQSPSLEDFTE